MIEVQGSSLFLSAFLYDGGGRATWVVSNGPMSGASQYSGALVSFSGGQTLNGAFQQASQSPALGTAALSFSDTSHATLT